MILDETLAKEQEEEKQAEKLALENRLKRMSERQLKADLRNVEIALKTGSITQDDANTQKEILKIGYKMDIGELSDAEGDSQIEKLLNS